MEPLPTLSLSSQLLRPQIQHFLSTMNTLNSKISSLSRNKSAFLTKPRKLNPNLNPSKSIKPLLNGSRDPDQNGLTLQQWWIFLASMIQKTCDDEHAPCFPPRALLNFVQHSHRLSFRNEHILLWWSTRVVNLAQWLLYFGAFNFTTLRRESHKGLVE